MGCNFTIILNEVSVIPYQAQEASHGLKSFRLWLLLHYCYLFGVNSHTLGSYDMPQVLDLQLIEDTLTSFDI
jgi:hypothetical protein